MTNISICLPFDRRFNIKLSDKATPKDILKALKKFFLRLDSKEFRYFFDPNDTTWNTDNTFYMSRRLERTGIKQYFSDGAQYENWFKEVTNEKAQSLTLKEKITAFFSKSPKAEKQEEGFSIDIPQRTLLETLANLNPEQAHILQRAFLIGHNSRSTMASSTRTLPGLVPSDSTYSAMASSTRTLPGLTPSDSVYSAMASRTRTLPELAPSDSAYSAMTSSTRTLPELAPSDSAYSAMASSTRTLPVLAPSDNALSEIPNSNTGDFPNGSSASAIPSSCPIFFKPKTDSAASSLQSTSRHQL